MRRTIPLLALLLLAPSRRGAAAEPVVASPFAGIPGVALDYYEVTGQDPIAIRAAIDAHRPTDPGDGERVDALSHWTVTWRYGGDGRGGCDLSTVTLRFAATVELPRLVGDVPADVRARWDRYMAALLLHESGHVRYAWDHLGAIEAAIVGATCATANAAAREAIGGIIVRDRAYDVATRHGQTQGAIFP